MDLLTALKMLAERRGTAVEYEIMKHNVAVRGQRRELAASGARRRTSQVRRFYHRPGYSGEGNDGRAQYHFTLRKSFAGLVHSTAVLMALFPPYLEVSNSLFMMLSYVMIGRVFVRGE
jgi:hypothetical protein